MPHTGPAPVSPIRLVSANVYVYNPTPEAAVDAMIAAGADVEVAVETSPAFRTLVEERDAGHPYSVVDGQLVVRSRYPVAAMTDPPGVPARRILRATVEGPAGPFVLYAVHALNPLSESTFASQLVWVKRLRAAASRESLPVVMAGDFNMSDRQLGYRRLTIGPARRDHGSGVGTQHLPRRHLGATAAPDRPRRHAGGLVRRPVADRGHPRLRPRRPRGRRGPLPLNGRARRRRRRTSGGTGLRRRLLRRGLREIAHLREAVLACRLTRHDERVLVVRR